MRVDVAFVVLLTSSRVVFDRTVSICRVWICRIVHDGPIKDVSLSMVPWHLTRTHDVTDVMWFKLALVSKMGDEGVTVGGMF